MAQDRAQGAREGHVDPGIDLRLRDAVEFVLDRIFDRHDVQPERIDARQRGVQRGGLARAGRTGDQYNAMGLVDQVVDPRQRPIIHAKGRQLELAAFLVEQTQHGTLAETGGQSGDTHVDLAARQAQRNAPVLRQALLGNVEIRHDLDAREHRRMQPAMRFRHRLQGAIEAEPDRRARLVGLDVNVRCALPQRLREQHVDHADDRCVVLRIEQILDPGHFLHQPGKVHVLLQIARDVGGGPVGLCIGLSQAALEHFGRLDGADAQRHAEHAPQLGQRLRPRAFAKADHGLRLAQLEQQHAMHPGERVGNAPDRGLPSGVHRGALFGGGRRRL